MIVGYCRVSSEAQGADGYGLEAQERAIRMACESRGWQQPRLVREIASGGNDARPRLASAIDGLDVGDVLMVARLDRLTRSVGHFAALMDSAKALGWDIVCLDPAVDMTTPYGRAMAGMAAVFAQLERELISQRTREGLAVARANGRIRMKITPEVGATIEQLREIGWSTPAIARHVGVNQSNVYRYLQKVRQL